MNKFEFKNLTPFKWFVLENFPFIEADFDALTEWQLFCKLGKEINKIIDSQNVVGSEMEKFSQAFIELQNYVNNYFDNLDVQDEINNKLNEMSKDGTLQEIISVYLNSKAIFGFDNVQSMKDSTNLINGSYAKTLGFYSVNDGGGALYKIIDDNTLIEDGGYIHNLNNGLKAVLITNNEINLKKIGAKGNDENDDTNYFKLALKIAKEKKINNIYIPSGVYRIYKNIEIDFPINIKGDYSINLENTSLISNNGTILSDFTNDMNKPFFRFYNDEKRLNGFLLNNIQFIGNKKEHTGIYFQNINNARIDNISLYNFNGTGLFLDNVFDTTFTNLIIMDCNYLKNNIPYYSLVLNSTTSDTTNHCHFSGCHIEGGDYLLYINNSGRLDFENSHIETWSSYNDYINPAIKIDEDTRALSFTACQFVLQGINNYLTNNSNITPDDVRYNIEIADITNVNSAIKFNNCDIMSGADGGKAIKSLGSSNRLLINNCDFYNLTTLSYALNLNNCEFTNNHLLFFNNLKSSKLAGTYFYNSNVKNNIIDISSQFEDNATYSVFTIENTNLEDNNIKYYTKQIYTLIGAPYNYKISRYNDNVSLTNTNFKEYTGIDLDTSNVIIPLNRDDTSHNSIVFNFSEPIQINKITNGFTNETLLLFNNTANNVVLSNSLPGGTDGRFHSTYTLSAGEYCLIRKIAFDWFIIPINFN